MGDELEVVASLGCNAQVQLQDATRSVAEAARHAWVHVQDASRAVAEAACGPLIGMPSPHRCHSRVAMLPTCC